jgi:hypothetical protein
MWSTRAVRTAMLAVAAVVTIGIGPPAWAANDPGPGGRQITHKDFDREEFHKSTRIDNRFLPMIPGTQFTLEGTSNLGPGVEPHRVVFTVTDVTKVINGVRTVVIWDRDIHQGRLNEEEAAFFAQDDSRNVWQLGEYPEELDERGKLIGAPRTWIAGVAGAEAGIHMLGRPRVGGPAYVQGSSPSIGFLNMAQVIATGQKTCTPLKCYSNVLVTDEFSPLVSPLEPPKGHVHKFHAPGVGIVRTLPLGEPEAETLELTKVLHLDRKALGEARNAALRLDRRAYTVAKDVYASTPRAEGPDDDRF